MDESEDDATARRALIEHYVPLMIAEYERIGMAAEMRRYFKGSSDAPVTQVNCERILQALKSVPSGIGFDAYCSRVGMDANEIRRIHELVRSFEPPSE